MIGQVINQRYSIQKLLGEGGFGSVYRALDELLKREVALKVLHIGPQNNPTLVAGFIKEAQIIGKLEHKNILRLYDFGKTERGEPFLVTELLQGASLETILQCYPLSIPQTFHVLRQVTEALEKAHRNGVTHRDVKPPNVFVHQTDRQEEIKLLDFGIAKVEQSTKRRKKNTQAGGAMDATKKKVRGTTRLGWANLPRQVMLTTS